MNYPTENDADNKFLNTESPRSSHWSSTKNPRIVRVSRNFGGKDRHSKVATIRGLRDRRIRLSVPTAIQLYDLQERLGLSQPSKAVDWLLDVAKEDIDSLPPLPMIPGFTHQPTTLSVLDHQFSLQPNMLQPNYHNINWGPPNLSLYQFGGGLSVAPQTDIPSTSQLHYSGPSANPLPSFFPPFFSSHNTQSMEINDHLRQINFLED